MESIRKSMPMLGRCVSQQLRQRSIPQAQVACRSMVNIADESHRLHRPTSFERKVLVWTKAYPSVAEVPEEVGYARMKKSKDIFRIRANILMIIASLGVGYLFMLWGRSDAQKGLTVHQKWRDMHKDYNERLTKSAGDQAKGGRAQGD